MIKILVLLLAVTSCSFKKNPLGNQILEGHSELYSEPDNKISSLDKSMQRIVIAATNDLEAHHQPHIIKFQDDVNEGHQKIRVGGIDAMNSYLKILRDAYKNVILVDSGDLLSSKADIDESIKFYDENKYDAITVGLGDFSLKLPEATKSNAGLFQEFARKSHTPLVLSNLYELKTARLVEWKGTAPYILKEVAGVKVGIIGLVPDDIATLTPVDNRIGLFVENMLQSTLRQARLLRSLGAEIIVVLTHQGTYCGKEIAENAKLPLSKVNFEPQKKGVCDTSDALGSYLQRLPPHLVDVVVGGRHHEKMANFVNETLAMSSFGEGKSFSYVEFFIDSKTKKVLKDKTVVHQPVMFCREFFKETKDCYTEDSSVNHSERIPATFLGKELNLLTPVDDLSASAQIEADAEKAIAEMSADIAFMPTTSGRTQLVNLKVQGKILLKMLEEDFNQGERNLWRPDPYRPEKDVLHITIQGSPIDTSQSYTVLTDLESLRFNPGLKKALMDEGTRPAMNFSWTSFESSDSIRTQLAAQKRQRQ